jgi:hypothetical protein
MALGAALAAAVLVAAPATVAGAAVTSSVSNVAPSSDGNGYSWVSYFRNLAGLGGVSRNATMESQEASHVRYLANHALACETNVHDELTKRVGSCGANRYATTGGKAAANNSNVTRVSVKVSDRTAVANWYSAAFHGLLLLDPRLTSTGYAAYFTAKPTGAKPLAWPYTAAVDVYRGRSGHYSGNVIAFPANNAASPLLSYQVGTESPEPLRTSTGTCKSWGTRTTVSAPVIIQWPLKSASGPAGGAITDLTTGKALATCSLTSGSYPAGSEQQMFLGGVNGITKAAFYYAAAPFTPGHRYQLKVKGAVITTFNATALPTAVRVAATPASKAVGLSWPSAAAGTGTVHNYAPRVYASAGCSGVVVSSVNTTSRSALMKGLTSGRTYWARVATVNTSLGSRWSPCYAVRPS